MAHKIRITPQGEQDLRSIGDYIAAQHAPVAALRLVQSLRGRIASLKEFPEAYGLAPEAEAAGVQLRQMTHGMYRVLYTVDETAVVIHGVRHGARRPLTSDELPPNS